MELNDDITLYEILEISSTASPQDIREAYLRTKTAYNRSNPALYTLVSPEEREAMIQRIEDAYEILSNPEKKREYDNHTGSLLDTESLFISQKEPNELENVVSIDRYPPMENLSDPNETLIPPSTDFRPTSDADLEPPMHHTQTPDTPMKPKTHSQLFQAIESEIEWRGSFLKKIRETYKISLEEMMGITKISKTYITAIENESFEKLPAPVYVRGFITQIAKALKLPSEKVAAPYLERYRQKRQFK